MPSALRTCNRAQRRRPRGIAAAALAVALLAMGAGMCGLAGCGDEGAQQKGTLHLETFVLNLADPGQRSYLRVGIDLGLGHEVGKKDTAAVGPVRDTILGVLGEAKVDELTTSGGKAKLKEELLRALHQRLPELGVEEVYASSQVDHKKVGKLAMAIQVAFQEMGVFPASTTQIPIDANDPMPFSTVQSIQNVKRTTELGRIASTPEDSLAGSSDQSDLAALQAELHQALHKEITQHEVTLHREADGLVVSLQDFGFFDSGSATIKPESMPALDRIASILAIRTYRLRIEGHTDNVPIHNAHMGSNWELSTARATELVRILIVDHNFAPERLAAAGYAEYHPVATNLTAEGRAQNRRVDIVILSAPPAATPAPAIIDPDSTAKPSPAVR